MHHSTMYFLICHDLGLLVVLSMLFSMLEITEAYDNVGLYKPSYQSNPYEGNAIYDAANAVDGFKSDLSIDGGQCVVSAAGYETATWRVDLGSVHYIDHITLYFMTDNQRWDESNDMISSFLGFSLYVSNSTNRLYGTLCFKDIKFEKATIPEVFNTTCRMFGQYVIYYNERLPGVDYPYDYEEDAENDLCEVEVYGCPTLNPDCDVWNPIMCACLVCKPRYMDIEPQHETIVKEKVMAIYLYGLIGVVCFLVLIIGALILYIVLTRMSRARNNTRQQQNKDMDMAEYNVIVDAFHNKGNN